ncbi:MAG: serine protease [Gammaproteobacteria bacterium]|nr:MAG: serine protease [Gammaproteobacteria bacterium]UCH41391.1 MAG: serine protease [Gammaproteobacteria bacterium]
MNNWLVETVSGVLLRKRSRLALFAMLLSMLSSSVNAAELSSVDELLGAVVGVHARVPPQARTAGALGTERFGSGVLIDSNGLIVTIGYLILEAEQVEIVLAGEERVPVEVLAYDYETGFGLLRATAELKIPPMQLGSSTGLDPGEKLLIASYGGSQTVRPAIFAGEREFAGYWEYLLEDALFTVPPYPRFGGAALIAPTGKLIGIGSLSVGNAVDNGQQTMPGNMFLPIDRLKAVLGDLLTEGRSSGSRKPWLGLYTEEIEGVLLVVRVAEDGPAMAAGIEPGDIIAEAGGKPVLSMADFYRKVWSQGEAGDTISVTVIKGADVHELEIRSVDRYQWLHLQKTE